MRWRKWCKYNKTAHNGIGIFGKEGYQSAYNSDCDISHFSWRYRAKTYSSQQALTIQDTQIIYFEETIFWKRYPIKER